MDRLKHEIRKILHFLFFGNPVNRLLLFLEIAVLLYMVEKIESQKRFYSEIAAVNYRQQVVMDKWMYSRMSILKLIANKAGISDEEIIAVTGPEVFTSREEIPPLPMTPP